MTRTIGRSTVWTAIVSVALVSGCTMIQEEPAYRSVPLDKFVDPLAPAKDFPAWKPPKQFAVWIHPHRDQDQGILIGGHWIMVLLSTGSWYVEDDGEREPVPDAEASPEDVRAGVSALVSPGEAAVPYRLSEE